MFDSSPMQTYSICTFFPQFVLNYSPLPKSHENIDNSVFHWEGVTYSENKYKSKSME